MQFKVIDAHCTLFNLTDRFTFYVYILVKYALLFITPNVKVIGAGRFDTACSLFDILINAHASLLKHPI